MLHAVHHAVSRRFDRCKDRLRLKPIQQKPCRRAVVGGGKAVKAEVPLAEMFGYSTTLRSLSQGRATYSMEFKHYSEAPKNVAEAIINKYTGKDEKK